MNRIFTYAFCGAALITLSLAVTPAVAGVADVIASISLQIDEAPNTTAALTKYTKDKLLPLCTNEVFAKAVAAQNARKMTLEEVQKIDAEWQAAEEPLPIHGELMGNPCAKEIVRIVKANPELTEVFVMDNQGANVGQNVLTSDYWQGDEPKWRNSYRDGKGGVDISESKLDKSTNRTDQKVSLPILDADGAVIGAICIGVAL
jgi:hypothetical protein